MYRKQGNKFFTKKEYTKAIEQYNLGVENKEENLHLILSNRSLSYYNLEDYRSSLKDCVEICKIKNGWYKGWFRLSQTLEKIGEKEKSEKAYQRYKELELNLKKDNLVITKKSIEQKRPNLNTKLMKEIMKDGKMMNIVDKIMKNDKIRSKLMNNEFKSKIIGNKDILNNPMSLMTDKNFQDIFSETLKILQKKDV